MSTAAERNIWPTFKDRDWASMDSFRFDRDGKIVDHWDVLERMSALARRR